MGIWGREKVGHLTPPPASRGLNLEDVDFKLFIAITDHNDHLYISADSLGLFAANKDTCERPKSIQTILSWCDKNVIGGAKLKADGAVAPPTV